MELLVATRNPGKVREYRHLLVPFEASLCFPLDFDIQLKIQEDGSTYLENAHKKALAYSQALGLLTLADDSGLEVDALGGAPGIHSARYIAGTDVDRVDALLTQLLEVPDGERTARFRCVLAVVTPAGQLHGAEGICEGLIARKPTGQGGFGYDPVFYLPEYGCTMAQLPEEEKNRISHRGRAVEAAAPMLRHLLDQ